MQYKQCPAFAGGYHAGYDAGRPNPPPDCADPATWLQGYAAGRADRVTTKPQHAAKAKYRYKRGRAWRHAG